MNRRDLISGAAVFLVACLVYVNSLGGAFVSDDRPLVLEHPYTRSLHDLPRIFTVGHYGGAGGYRPLTTVSFALNYFLRGARPGTFHLVNVLLHGLVSVLVYLLVVRIFRSRTAALVAALLFAVHPIHTEAVAWISGRAELLSAFFFLLSWLLYLRATASTPAKSGAFILSLGTFFAGVLSKENALMLPCAIVAGDFYLAQRETNSQILVSLGKKLRLYAAFAGVIIFYFAFRWSLYHRHMFRGSGLIAFNDNPAANVGRITRGLTAIKVLGEYFGLLIWPRHLTADYSFNAVPLVHSIGDAGLLLGVALILLLLAIATLSLLRRGKIWLPIAIAFITIAPTANLFFPIGTIKAERLLYLPSVAFCCAVGLVCAAIFARLAGRTLPPAAKIIFVVTLFLLGFRTWKRNEEWRTEFVLWSATAHTAPQNYRAQMLLAAEYLRAGSPEAATVMYRRAIAIDPSSEDALVDLGVSMLQAGRFTEAAELFEHAIEQHPLHAAFHLNLGLAYAARGDILSAAEKFRDAIKLKPDGPIGYLNLGLALSQMGNKEEALENYRRSAELKPDLPEAWNAVGAMLLKLNRKEEAREALQKAIALKPGYPEALQNLRLLDQNP